MKLLKIVITVLVSMFQIDNESLKITRSMAANEVVVGEKQITRDVRASQFIQAIGVNTHLARIRNKYKNSSLVLSGLNYLGVKHVRDHLPYPYNGQAREVIKSVADAGIMFDIVPNRVMPELGPSGMTRYLSAIKDFKSRNPNSIYALEGLNEVNLFSFKYKGEWSLPAAAEFQKYYYSRIKADPVLSNVKFVNTSIAHRDINLYRSLGDLSDFSDASNSHVYTQTGSTSDKQLKQLLDLASINAPNKPIFITEMGHPTLADSPGIGASHTAQAKLLITNLFTAWQNGARRIYVYELFDNYTESAERSLKEAHFGLFNADGTPKLSATTLRNLLAILSHGNNGKVDGNLQHEFSVHSPNAQEAAVVHAMSLEKSNTSYNIAVWTDKRLRGGQPAKDLVLPVVNTVVKFGHLARKVRVYDPIKGIAPILTAVSVNQITIPLKDRPLIVEVDVEDRVRFPANVSSANRSLKAAKFIALIDQISKASGLRTITLTDTQVLPVSSEEAIKHIIANYGPTLAKIKGSYSFKVSYEHSTLRKENLYAADGRIQQRREYILNNDKVMGTKAVGSGGTTLIYDANGIITSRTVER